MSATVLDLSIPFYNCENVHDDFLALPKRKKPSQAFSQLSCFFAILDSAHKKRGSSYNRVVEFSNNRSKYLEQRLRIKVRTINLVKPYHSIIELKCRHFVDV